MNKDMREALASIEEFASIPPSTVQHATSLLNNIFQMAQAALSQQQASDTPVYEVRPNHCKCHPETCACSPWAIFEGDDKFCTLFNRDTAEKICTALNAKAGQQQASGDELVKALECLLELHDASGNSRHKHSPMAGCIFHPPSFRYAELTRKQPHRLGRLF